MASIKQLPPTAPEGFDQEAWTAIRTLIERFNTLEIPEETGEANTASNLTQGGLNNVPIFSSKQGVDLRFRSIAYATGNPSSVILNGNAAQLALTTSGVPAVGSGATGTVLFFSGGQWTQASYVAP